MKRLIRNIRETYQDMDKWLLWITVTFIVYGLLNIVTASSSEAVNSEVPLYYYFYQQLKMVGIAFFASLILLKMDTKNYSMFAAIAYFGVLGLLVYLSLHGEAHRGSVNWIKLGPIRFQPSEFAKPVVIVCLSLVFEKFYRKLKNKKISHIDMLGIIFFVGCVFPVIIFLQKDFGTAFLSAFTTEQSGKILFKKEVKR